MQAEETAAWKAVVAEHVTAVLIWWLIFKKPSQTNIFLWLPLRSKCVYADVCVLFFSHGKSLRNQRGKAALPSRAVCVPCFDKPSRGLWQAQCSALCGQGLQGSLTTYKGLHFRELFRLCPSQTTAKLSDNSFIVKDYLQRTSRQPQLTEKGLQASLYFWGTEVLALAVSRLQMLLLSCTGPSAWSSQDRITSINQICPGERKSCYKNQ